VASIGSSNYYGKNMNLKTIFLGAGWVLLLGAIAVIAFATVNPKLADALLWRFESLEKSPTSSQRLFEFITNRHNRYIEQYLPEGIPVFLGDSHLQLIPPQKTTWAANFAIGGQRMKQIIAHVQNFKSLATAKTIFVNGGANDLLAGDTVDVIGQNWRLLMAQLPRPKKLVCVGLPEAPLSRLNADDVAQLNKLIAEICKKNGGQFLAIQLGVGEFKDEQLAGDKLHLSRSAVIKLVSLMEQIHNQP
jgi:hypothetical protein